MYRNHHVLLIFTLLTVCVIGGSVQAASKPNFVFILVDDLGWADPGCYGSTFYETPNIDRLASGGMRFTNAYASCPVCSPTRASIVSGKHPSRVRITTTISATGRYNPENWHRRTLMLPARYHDRLLLEEVTIAEALKKAGYATFFAGKWHLGPKGFWPEDQGFDVNIGGHHKGSPSGGKKYFSPYGNPRLKDGPPGEYLPERLAAETVKFIKEHRDEPFLAYLSFYSVHTPLMTKKHLKDKYEEKRKSVKHDGPRWEKERRCKVRQVQDHPVYAGMVEAMDQAVGNVLDTIKQLGLEKDTIVFFTSDNGGLSTADHHPTCNLPLRAGKGWVYEGGIREPLIVRWPGVTKPDSVCNVPVISMDFYPTILAMAGLPARPKQHVDGQNMVPLLQGKKLKRGPLFWHFPHYANQGGAPAAAIRDGDWKLIEWYEDGHLELYNLANDPGEKHNLAQAKPIIRDELHKKLDDWRKSLDVWMPTPRALDDPLRPKSR